MELSRSPLSVIMHGNPLHHAVTRQCYPWVCVVDIWKSTHSSHHGDFGCIHIVLAIVAVVQVLLLFKEYYRHFEYPCDRELGGMVDYRM